MLVLLPPSEGKTAPARGAPVDLDRLSFPALTAARERVLDALVEASARPDATDLLRVSPGLADEIRANVRLRSAPAAPADRVYTGVLYGAAGLAHLTGTARRRATQSVRIVSALWGAVRPSDRIPAYRLSMGVDLPGLGTTLARFWRAPLAAALEESAAGDVVVDGRSAAYAAAWSPPRTSDHVLVQVVRERPDGGRQVVSHHAKHARGLLTRHLLTRAHPAPRTAEGVADAAQGLTGTPTTTGGHIAEVELADPGASGSRTLTLVERA